MIKNILKFKLPFTVTIISTILPASAYALGLGEIEVKSRLGEPLRASVRIYGANENLEESCFKVLSGTDGVNWNKLTLKLGAVVNNEALLSISSVKPVDDPIVNLALAAECNFSLRRDYVILLDPLLQDEPTPTILENSEKVLSATTTTSKATTKKKAEKEEVSTKRSSSGSKKQETELPPDEAGSATNPSKPLASPEKPPGETTQQPRLLISGGGSGDAPGQLALRMDTELHMAPETSPQPFTETDVLDEVTAMNNRLAHLEKQLVSLQARNRQIETERQSLAVQAEEEKKSAALKNILSLIAGAGLFAMGYFLYGRWNQRRQKLLLGNEEVFWSAIKSETDSTSVFEDTTLEPAPQNAGSTNTNSPDPSAGAEAIMVESADENEILDIADAFLTHDRSNLAIQLLQDHLAEFPSESETAWFFLLDLLAREGFSSEYQHTVTEFKKYYNIDLPPQPTQTQTSLPGFESYPHLLARLQQVWGTPAALSLLDSLIYNDRKQLRNGFNKNVFEELVLLRDVAVEQMKSIEAIEGLLVERNSKIEQKKQALDFTTETPTENVPEEKTFLEKEAPLEFEPLPELNLTNDSSGKPPPDEGLEFKL